MENKTRTKTRQEQQDKNQVQEKKPKRVTKQKRTRTTADQIYFGDAASELSANCHEIQRSPGICWIIWWIFVFLGLIGICILHLLSNVKSFISYQTFTALREDHVDKLRIPRVTVCMSNWIRKEKFEKVRQRLLPFQCQNNLKLTMFLGAPPLVHGGGFAARMMLGLCPRPREAGGSALRPREAGGSALRPPAASPQE